MTLYGIINTVSHKASIWAMLFSPWLIDKFGKHSFKPVKNFSQIFIALGLTPDRFTLSYGKVYPTDLHINLKTVKPKHNAELPNRKE